MPSSYLYEPPPETDSPVEIKASVNVKVVAPNTNVSSKSISGFATQVVFFIGLFEGSLLLQLVNVIVVNTIAKR